MAQVGRISGPLLFANLERQGKDLAFRNDRDTTELLYLNVNGNKIGVDTDTPTRELEISTKTQTQNLITDQLQVPDFTILGSTISKDLGNILLDAETAVRFGGLSNGNIFIKDNSISTQESNSSLDLVPNGAGSVNFLENTNVYGDFFTPKNIVLEGTITFGNENTDTINFDSEIDSDLIPNQTNTEDLGSPSKRWRNVYTNLVNGESVTTDSITSGQIDFNLRQGNVFYVSTNGDDANYGDNQQAPFSSIKRALEAADASIQGSVDIFVYPGEYEEELPLIVPPNVSVIGTELRNCRVKPDSSSQSQDVFLLDGDTAVQNLTIADFYNSYAFRFRPGANISNRSPYIQNVTVITKGTEVSTDDPRGFESQDAGKGAFIDGSELDSESLEASMLFNSCTFITPGVDCITMTNGVRVEWLACFVYFANRGLYALNGTQGRTLKDGSTIDFGAEIRSIASANIYGNFGVVADGNDCFAKLIKHNFSYIGSGKHKDNDKTRAKQDQETQELNDGRIFFTSIDHLGTYRVGETFFANFETGETSISAETVAGDTFSQIEIVDGDEDTFIDADSIDTGNIEINGNLIESFQGEINISSAQEINLESNTNISKNLDITGNLAFDGSLSVFGNETSDTVDFNTPINQDFAPNEDRKFNLGSTIKSWHSVYANRSDLDGITVFDNVITTNASNSDLELRAPSAGRVGLERIFAALNSIETDTEDFVLASNSELVIDSNGSFQIPVGAEDELIIEPIEDLDGGDSDDASLTETVDGGASDTIYTAQDDVYNGDTATVEPTGATGDIRFNTDVNLFEGFNNGTVSFGGVYSDDRQTSVTADPTEDKLIFKVLDNQLGKAENDAILFDRIQVDDIAINENRVFTNVSDSDLDLMRYGTGEVRIGNLSLTDNRIKNYADDDALSFSVIDLGYQKITGTNGVVVPVGSTSTRPNTPEVGETRWNTSEKILEVWDGSFFTDAGGTSQFVSEEEFEDIVTEYTLMFG